MLSTYQKSKASSKNDCFKDGYVNLLSHHKNSQAHVSRTLLFFLRLLRMILMAFPLWMVKMGLVGEDVGSAPFLSERTT